MRNKTYTVSLGSAQRQISHGFSASSKFIDHGRNMIVTEVRPPYREGREWLVDFLAMEQGTPAEALKASHEAR
jgi:hypothetical protein